MDDRFSRIIGMFDAEGTPVSCERYGSGHINETYLVEMENGKRYILQKINRTVFTDVTALMKNITAVTDYLQARSDAPRSVMSMVFTKDGASHLIDDRDDAYRMYQYVENSTCLQEPHDDGDVYGCALAFGRFLHKMSGFPAQTLQEVLPRFHDTPDRYRKFHAVLDRNPVHRNQLAEDEIAFVLQREQDAGVLQQMRERGELPLRVTHNDTKLNNVLFDVDTRKALCVVDLDTVMPGLSAYDFGDAVRFGAATVAEDEQDLSLVNMSLDRFRLYVRGFLQGCPDLTEAELQLLPQGAKTMTLECGMRFLTDYLDGDHYFRIHEPEQNLHRCRTQLRLVADMESKWWQMQDIVREEKRKRNEECDCQKGENC